MRLPLFALTTVAAVAAACPAAAKTLTYRAALDGTMPPTLTGSPASGAAVIKVDTQTKRISVDLDVRGITLGQLSAALVAKPIGPVHLNEYHTADDVELVLPVPFGTTYSPTKTGFHVSMRGYDYAAGVKLLETGSSFDDFLNAMNAGRIVLNIHTDKFPEGEISGSVKPS